MGISLALLLGSAAAFLVFALPQYTLEKITVATRLARLMVQAEPPISGDDRILLAILAGVGTTGIGWVLIDWLFFGRAGLSAFVRSRRDLYDDVEDAGGYRPSDPLDLVLPGPVDGAGSAVRGGDARRPLSARTDIGDPPLSPQPSMPQPSMPQPAPPLSPFAAAPGLDDLLPPLDRLASAPVAAPNPTDPVSLLGLAPSASPTILDLGSAAGENASRPTLLDLAPSVPVPDPVDPQPAAAPPVIAAPPAPIAPIPPISAWPPVPPVSPPPIAPIAAAPAMMPNPVTIPASPPPAAASFVEPAPAPAAGIFASFPPDLPRHDTSLIMPPGGAPTLPPAEAPAAVAAPVPQPPVAPAPAPIAAPPAIPPAPVASPAAAPAPVAPAPQVPAPEVPVAAAVQDFTPDIFDRAPIEDLLNRLEGRIRQRRLPVRAAPAVPPPEPAPVADVVVAPQHEAESVRRPLPPGFASTRLVEFPPPEPEQPAPAAAAPIPASAPAADGDDLLDQPLYIALERLRGLIKS